MSYLDFNATAPVLPEALHRMLPYFSEKAGNPSSVHGPGRLARMGLDSARRQMAQFLAVRESQVIFTSGGTESNNLAILGLADQPRAQGAVITSSVEHPSVLKPCALLEQQGIPVVRLPVDGQGLVDPESLRQALRQPARLVSIMHANNETGVVQPMAELAALCRQAGVVMHTDAVQTVGKWPVTLPDLGVSMLSLSGHKFGAAKGVGCLIVDSGLTLTPRMLGGGHERGRRSGTENLPGIISLATAMEWTQANLEQEMARLRDLRQLLEEQIREALPQAIILGDQAPRLANTLAILLPELDGETLVMVLDMEGFAVSSGSACSSGKVNASHVVTAMGFGREYGRGMIRISLGWSTTREELAGLVPALARTVRKLTGLSGLKAS